MDTVIHEDFQDGTIHQNVKRNCVIIIGLLHGEVVGEIAVAEAVRLTTFDIDLPVIIPIHPDGYFFTGVIEDVDVQAPVTSAENRRLEFKAGIALRRNRYWTARADRGRTTEQSFVMQ